MVWKTRPRRLRWRLAVPMILALVLIWWGTMSLLADATRQVIQQRVDDQFDYVQEQLEFQWQNYSEEKGLTPEELAKSRNAIAELFSGYALSLTDIAVGGIAVAIRDAQGNLIRSQLTWGLGDTEDLNKGQRWYLNFDDALDDQGQLELAQWITQQRTAFSGGFELYPTDSRFGPIEKDGTYARVTGIQRPGYAIVVQKLEIIRPDGTVEAVFETGFPGENPITVELRYLSVYSAALSGGNSERHMARLLADFREAHAILDRVLTEDGEERAVLTDGGRVRGTQTGATARWVTMQCDLDTAVWEQERDFYLRTLIFTALVGVALSWYLSRKVTRPAEELCRQTEAGRCREDGPVKELNALAVSFNAARDQLAGQLEREREFTRAAAHELKTPLAVLRAHGEALWEDIDARKREQYLDVILDECDRMSALVGSLLELSRLEAGAGLRREGVELSGLVRAVWGPLALSLERKGVSLMLELEEVRLAGDRERLREAAGNLASNALRHCTPGGAIRVTLKREGDRAVLAVYNDGEPIPAADLPHLFQPFYRGDKSRSRDSGGTGLGLAIVQAAVRAHGGECGAENTGSGVTFWLFLPLDG